MFLYVANHWVDGVNAIGAWLAGLAHIYAATHVSGRLRHLFIAIAALAWLYSAAYWVLFFELVSVATWSDFLRPIGIITWGIAWAVEPLVFVNYMKRRGNELVHGARVLTEDLRKTIDNE